MSVPCPSTWVQDLGVPIAAPTAAMAVSLSSRQYSRQVSEHGGAFASSFVAAATTLGGQWQGSAPVAACSYQADPRDPMDMMFSWCLFGLDRSAASKLRLRRFGPGCYEVDGRMLDIGWSDAHCSELIAREADVKESPVVPLRAYLAQAAHVAASLSGQNAGLPAVSRVPPEMRLTFDDRRGASASDMESIGVMERSWSMRLACVQARMREKAAEVYRFGLSPGLHA